MRVGPPDSQGANAVLFTGGLHAREWVPPDALVSLAADVLEAHSEGTGLRYGSQRFSADEVRSVVGGLQLVVFPCVNPDGRHHSQTAEPMWRKNRRRVNAGSPPSCVGVDINRNFDALWNFRRHFAPDSHVSASDNPCDPQVYVGPTAASEAETRNVVALFDRYPRARWFVDVHPTSRRSTTTWGFDENQTSNPNMNFRNPAFDGQRGRGGDAYREFIPAGDLPGAEGLGSRIHQAIATTGGTTYSLEQSFSLYPTSGSKRRLRLQPALVQRREQQDPGLHDRVRATFQPPWEEAQNVIRELSAGLLRCAWRCRHRSLTYARARVVPLLGEYRSNQHVLPQ